MKGDLLCAFRTWFLPSVFGTFHFSAYHTSGCFVLAMLLKRQMATHLHMYLPACREACNAHPSHFWSLFHFKFCSSFHAPYFTRISLSLLFSKIGFCFPKAFCLNFFWLTVLLYTFSSLTFQFFLSLCSFFSPYVLLIKPKTWLLLFIVAFICCSSTALECTGYMECAPYRYSSSSANFGS